MSLLHAVVARGEVILTEHDRARQAYAPTIQTILSKIPDGDSKLTYSADTILIHYVKLNGVIALVVAEDGAGRRMPFAFLNSLHQLFTSTYGENEVTDAIAYGMASFEGEISRLMSQFQDSPPADPIKSAQTELANVKDIMVKNLESVLSRGERIELLVNKTDTMSAQALAFRKRSTTLRRSMWWKNTRVTAIMGTSGVLFFYLLLANFCGLRVNHCGA